MVLHFRKCIKRDVDNSNITIITGLLIPVSVRSTPPRANFNDDMESAIFLAVSSAGFLWKGSKGEGREKLRTGWKIITVIAESKSTDVNEPSTGDILSKRCD